MIKNSDIASGSITESKLSKSFELKHSRLQKASEGGQLLIAKDDETAKDDRSFEAKTIYGDGTIDASGRLTVKFPKATTVITGDGLTDEQKEKLDGIEAGATRDKTPAEVKSAYEENSDTNAFTDSNRNQLDSTHSTYLGDVSNHTGSSTSTDSNANTSTTKRPYEVIEYTPPTNYNSSNVPITFTHLMPYIPDVSVYLVQTINNETVNTEIDAEVKATAASGNQTGDVEVVVSESNLNLKIVAK